MAKFEEKVKELLAKHPHLTQPEAEKILTEKNARKKQRRQEKTERINTKKLRNAEKNSGDS